MRFVKENSTHAEEVCNRVKRLTRLSHETDGFETQKWPFMKRASLPFFLFAS